MCGHWFLFGNKKAWGLGSIWESQHTLWLGISPLRAFIFNYRVIQKKYATGKPDPKDLNENLAAAQGLAHMITECNRLFEVRSWDEGQAGKERMLISFSSFCDDSVCLVTALYPEGVIKSQLYRKALAVTGSWGLS